MKSSILVAVVVFAIALILSPVTALAEDCAESDEACWLVKLDGENMAAALRASMALGRLKSTAAVEPLIMKLKSSDQYMATAAANALVMIGDAAVPALVEATESKSAAVRKYAGWALGRIGGGSAAQAVGRLARDEDPETRARAAQAMSRLKDPRSLLDLVMLLQDRDRKVRLEAIRAMSFYKDQRVVRPLIDQGLTDLDDRVSQEAAGVIILVGPSAIPELLKTYDGSEAYVQKRALFVLGELAAKADPPEKKAVKTLLHRVVKSDSSSWELRRSACVGLASVGDAASQAILEELIVRYQDTTDAAAFVHAARNAQEQIRARP